MVNLYELEPVETVMMDRNEARRTVEGRAWLRDVIGQNNRHSLDSTSKQFIAWDGEGITHHPNTPQSYVLMAASTGDYIESTEQLRTVDCFDLMLRVKAANPNSIMVGFAFGYDSEMMMADLGYTKLERILSKLAGRWCGPRCDWDAPFEQGKLRPGEYRIEYMPRKWFQVTGRIPGHSKNITCKIWDIWGFFQGSYLKALTDFLPTMNGGDYLKIWIGKNRRGGFTTDDLTSGMMLDYCNLELHYLVELMDKMRELLVTAELCPSQWHGPSAISDKMFTKWDIQRHKTGDLCDGLLDASQFAYSGGRFENFVMGRAHQKVYQWDINSAYPAAMRSLPSLAGRTWVLEEWHTNWDDLDSNRFDMYALYYVDFNMPPNLDLRAPMPLPHRAQDTSIKYPIGTSGWYWGPEVNMAFGLNYWMLGSCQVRAIWRLDDGPREYPFREPVNEMYDRRRALKRAGDQTQYPIKIGLNSLYGKMCQRAGYDRSGKIPKWHQLEWAGYVTSWTRAEIYNAALHAFSRGALIAVETDAIFTTCDMSDVLPIGDGLGQWDKTEYDDIVYLQSGIYWYKDQRKGWQAKTRGMDKESMTFNATMDYLRSRRFNHLDPEEYDDATFRGITNTRFLGARAAMHIHQFPKWRSWITSPNDLQLGYNYKRVHIPNRGLCGECREGRFYPADGMHDMTNWPSEPEDRRSKATRLPWRKVQNEADEFDAPPDEIWDQYTM